MEKAELEAKSKIDENLESQVAYHRYYVESDFNAFLKILLQQHQLPKEVACQVASQLALASTLRAFSKDKLQVKVDGSVLVGAYINTDTDS